MAAQGGSGACELFDDELAELEAELAPFEEKAESILAGEGNVVTADTTLPEYQGWLGGSEAGSWPASTIEQVWGAAVRRRRRQLAEVRPVNSGLPFPRALVVLDIFGVTHVGCGNDGTIARPGKQGGRQGGGEIHGAAERLRTWQGSHCGRDVGARDAGTAWWALGFQGDRGAGARDTFRRGAPRRPSRAAPR
jgi:hypothetical protein